MWLIFMMCINFPSSRNRRVITLMSQPSCKAYTGDHVPCSSTSKNDVLSCVHKHMKVEMDHDTEITLQGTITYGWTFRNPANHLRLVVYPMINKVLAPFQVVSRISSINRITYRLALLRTKSRLGMAGACGWWFAQGEPGAVCFVVVWCFFVETIQVINTYDIPKI